MANTATQTDAITNGKADKLAVTAGTFAKTTEKRDVDMDFGTQVVHSGGVDSSAGALASTPVFVSGTAKQLNTVQDAMLYININTAAALKVEVGPTSAAATTISASQSSALGLMTVRVPKGWYVKLTGTMANLTLTQIVC